jgi:hypothetical protein
MDEEDIREVINYKKRQPYIVFLFFVLLAIPLAFSVISFLNLKDCQNNPSNGCPNIYLPSLNGNSVQPSDDYSTGQPKEQIL